MIISERAKYILFFLALALAYGVRLQEVMYFYGDDIKLILTEHDYPLVKFGGWHPHRLVDLFYQSVWSNFYFKYIQGVLIEPLFGQQHFLDTFRQMSLVSGGLIMSALCFLSILYVSVFVKLSFKEMAVFAALFYLLFTQYLIIVSVNLLHATILVFVGGLAFLYPIFAYVLARKNVFSEWNEYRASALMLILSYVACFSYFYTMMFVSVGSFALATIYLFENYKRSDFSSRARFLTKIKAEPKWLLTIIVSLPTFMLASVLIAANSNRFLSLQKQGGDYDFMSSLKEYTLDNVFILLAAVFIIWAWNAYRNKTERIDKALYFRYGIIALSLFLFVILFELLHQQIGYYIYTAFTYIRFVVTTVALGYGFKIMKQGWAIVPMYFLFFILAAGGVRALVSQKSNSVAYYHHNAMKVAINLGYTFSCYGTNLVPFYDKRYTGNTFSWLPYPESGYRWQWYRLFARYTRISPWPWKGKNYTFVYYLEPSLEKINNQLKVLRETKRWQCARIKNDIYRIEKLPY